jgi:hypothetical protein
MSTVADHFREEKGAENVEHQTALEKFMPARSSYKLPFRRELEL